MYLLDSTVLKSLSNFIHWLLIVVSEMSSSSDEDIAAAYLLVKRRKKKTYRNFWVNPFYTINLRHSSYIVAQELNNDSVKFHGFYRMSKDTFKILAELLKPEISKKDTNYRKAITSEERLLITLR